MVEDAKIIIAALHYLGHKVYIISGGLAEPVEEFGVYLGVPRHRIRAVNVDYDKLAGRWWESSQPEADESIHEKYRDFEEGALTISDGKAQIVKELLNEQNGRSILIGDGSSDLLASRAVNLFVGYGGVIARQRVRHEAPIFLHSPSLAPLLVIASGPAALRRLQDTPYQQTFEKGIHLIQTGALSYNDDKLKSKLTRAFTVAP
jgi:phosphoserine phosphatase